jgi:tetraacyldisaccharide 4'-kinase
MTAKQTTRLERLFLLGRPFSPLYSCLMANRSSFYRKGFIRQHKLDVPVISVGNLILGGTGKTPLVLYIARILKRHGRKPAILSRGYKGKAKAAVNVVSDSTNILLDAVMAGDEPRLLAEKLPGIPVLTGKRRSATGRFAIRSLAADSLILDDGFQHLAVKRDLDLVLFSGQKLIGNGHVLPGGELREPLSSLKRADAFIMTGVDTPPGAEVAEFIRFLKDSFPGKPVFSGSYQAEDLLPIFSHGKHDTILLVEAKKLTLYGFCGIAQPESFKTILNRSQTSLAGFHAFPDHHSYSPGNVDSLCGNAKKSGAGALITTEKDLVKLRNLYTGDLPLLALPIQLTMEPEFDRYLLNRIDSLSKAERTED